METQELRMYCIERSLDYLKMVKRRKVRASDIIWIADLLEKHITKR